MKLNNKGLTLVEIIISIALISIVLIFIFSLLIDVNNMNNESEINSTYLINKALIIKNIEEDVKDATAVRVASCNITNFYDGYGKGENYFDNKVKNNANMCMELELQKTETETAYLAIYYYNTDVKKTYVISYINSFNNVRITRELPDFALNNVSEYGGLVNCTDITVGGDKLELDTSNNSICKLDGKVTLSGFSTITIPIIGSDGKDYTLIIPFYIKQ